MYISPIILPPGEQDLHEPIDCSFSPKSPVGEIGGRGAGSFPCSDGAWRKVLDTMRDRRAFDAGQESYFRRVPFDPDKTCFPG